MFYIAHVTPPQTVDPGLLMANGGRALFCLIREAGGGFAGVLACLQKILGGRLVRGKRVRMRLVQDNTAQSRPPDGQTQYSVAPAGNLFVLNHH